MQKKRNVCPPSSCVDVSLSAMVPVSRRVGESIAAVIDGLVQDCINSSALAMELLQPCTKPS